MSTRRGVIGALRWLALAPVLLALAPVAAQAADLRQGQDVTIPAGTTVTDDLYAGAGTVTVDGTIAGSLIAAGGNVHVSGTVQRDVMVTGGTVTISGPVMGSVRMAGGTLTLSGPVTEDVVAAGGTLDVVPGATIGRDLVVAGGTATVTGDVGRDLTVSVGTLDLRGRVERNVRAEVTNLRLESGASVGGNLDYASNNAAQIDSGATVSGAVKHSPASFGAQPTAAQRATDAVIGWIRTVVGLFALGLLVLLPFGAFGRRASDTIGRAPWASLGWGLAVLVGVPIAAGIVFVLGLLVGGWPLSLAALALLAIATAIGYVLTALFVGRTGFRLLGHPEVHPLLALLVGLAVLAAVGLIPFLGGLVGLAAVVLGLGALTLTLFRSWRGPAPAAAGTQGATVVPGVGLPA
jgi:cytoskeletal protein CcmA (bactofilin family)